MTQQTINVGSAPNDGTGDLARTAFTKCNANFTDLYAADTTFLTTTAASTGFVGKTGDTMTGALVLSGAAVGLQLTGRVDPSIQFTPSSGSTTSSFAYQQADLFKISNNTTDILKIDLVNFGMALKGNNGTSSAATGEVGEFVQANKTTSSGSLSAGAIGTYHSTTLTAGDWDVWVHASVICAASGSSFEIELTTGSSLSGSNLVYCFTSMATPSSTHAVDLQPARFLLTASTTINLNYRAGVTGCSITNAYIAARRRR